MQLKHFVRFILKAEIAIGQSISTLYFPATTDWCFVNRENVK